MELDDDLDPELPDDLQPNPVDAVVFDLGNVLIRWDPQAAVAQGVGTERAAAFLADADFDFAGWNAQQDAGRSWDDAIAEKIRSHPQYEQEMRAYREHFAESVREPIDATVAILRELHRAEIPLFALTNWSEELFPVAEELHDFLDLFEEIIVSGEEGVAKPDPAVFEVLAQAVRHVGGLDDCVFIDDNPDNVQAAAVLGMDAVHFTDPESLRTDLLLRGLPLDAADAPKNADAPQNKENR